MFKIEHILILVILVFILYYISIYNCYNNGFSVGSKYDETCSDFWELSTCLDPPFDCQSDGLDGRRNHSSNTVDFAEKDFDDTLNECCESCEAASPTAEAIRVTTEEEEGDETVKEAEDYLLAEDDCEDLPSSVDSPEKGGPWSDGRNDCKTYERNPTWCKRAKLHKDRGSPTKYCCVCDGGNRRDYGDIEKIFKPSELPEHKLSYINNCIDLYKLIISVLADRAGKYDTDDKKLDKLFTGETGERPTKDVIRDKGFILERRPIFIDLDNYDTIRHKPMLLECILGSSAYEDAQHINFLAIPHGSAADLEIYYRLAKKICTDLKSVFGTDLKGTIFPFIIIGHSSGAGALLCLVNELLTINPDFPIKTCITSGLGLCDSYTVDTFQMNVINKNIEYYDIMNFADQNLEGNCYENISGDNWITMKTNESIVCNIGSSSVTIFCNKFYVLLIKDNLQKLINAENAYEELQGKVNTILEYLEDRVQDKELPPNYIDYYTDKFDRNLLRTFNNCKNKNNCIELIQLFHKHVSYNTLALVRISGKTNYYRYNKNYLLVNILNSTDIKKVTIGDEGLVKRIDDPNDDPWICLTSRAHDLKTYVEHLKATKTR